MSAPGSYLQTLLALLLVLALIIACAYVLKRVQRPVGGAHNPMRIRGQLVVGTRERIVLVEVGDQWIVTGVAPGNVRQLAVLPRQHAEPDTVTPPEASLTDFRSLLTRFSKS